MVKQLLTVGFLITTYLFLSAQSILIGKVVDAIEHEPIPFANVILYKNGVQKWGVQSDFDGLYRLVAMEAGIYDVEISLVSYQKSHHAQVHLRAGHSIKLDIELKRDTFADAYPILGGKIPIVQISNTSIIMGRVTMNSESLPYINVVLLQGRMEVARVVTDADGLYRIIDLNSGTYDIEFSQIGYPKTRISNVKLVDNQCFTAHAEIKESNTQPFYFDRQLKRTDKQLDSVKQLPPKPLKYLGCRVTSGSHSPLFYISSCQMQVNPADTIVYAETPSPTESLQITNAQGQEMLYRTHLPTGTQKINVSNWATGVYKALFKEVEYHFNATFSIIR
jgi:hypothetical protein